MNLRTRFALAFAAVAAAVAGSVGLLSYHAAADRITSELDRTLQTATTALENGQDGVLAVPAPATPSEGGHQHGDRFDEQRQLVAQSVTPQGIAAPLGSRDVALPISAATRALAASADAGTTEIDEVEVGGDTFRVLTTSLGTDRGALQVGVDIEDTERVLGGMANEIAGVSVAVLLVAAGAGWLLARRITARLARLARQAEHLDVEEISDAQPLPVEGRDEVARLSTSFNVMLGRLAASRDAQERLVQDAAHELRTPLTSLRTNAAVLGRYDELSPDARARLVADVRGETRELSELVEELVALALARRSDEPEQPVDLVDVVHRAAQRAHRRTGRDIQVHAESTIVRGQRQGLERAVGNLLENAAKFDGGTTAPISLTISRRGIVVADRGPGIAAADLEHIFDRFYRSDTARALPGSGLGLAIVSDVATAHGGVAFARNRAGGGAEVGFTIDPDRFLPSVDPNPLAIAPEQA
ncbi:MAG: HAMP domain-containing histidine kinase [Pseudonocardia sp.]|nr:HAMP domain-containing histidine kinase [Pseudonocardia sp.]